MADTQAKTAVGTDAEPLGTLTTHSAKDSPVVVIDRAAFNQGQNAKYAPHIEQTETMDTMVARGPHVVAYYEERKAEEWVG